MKNFIYFTILNNNFMAEIVCMILAFVTLIFMLETKPRPTKIYRLNFMGIIGSILSINLLVFMSVFARSVGIENLPLIRLYIIVFDIVYCFTLNSIYCYIDSLTYTNIIKKSKRKRNIIVFNVIYIVLCIYFAFGKNIVRIEGVNVYFSETMYFYLWAGIFIAICCFLSAVLRKKYIPKLVFKYIILFSLLDIIVLIAQLTYRDTMFEGVAYVFPLVICYIFFHSNPVDENSGCRNEFSFENHMIHCIRWKKKYAVINVYFPYNKNIENTERELMQHMVSYACREIEEIDPAITIYSKNSYTYNIVLVGMDDVKVDTIAMNIQEILSKPMYIGNAKYFIINKLIVVKNFDYLDTLDRYLAFIKYIDKKYFNSRIENEIHFAEDTDYTNFERQNNIYQMLATIRDGYDLDDERVICYAQPILEIESNRFKSAEALMRMKLGEEIIYPDEFIPIAEDNNMIHFLTCIMINKVCKKIKELEKQYDFDAITINCSTIEFDDLNFHEEVYEIIRKNNVSPQKIRIEITESNMIDSMGNIVSNMYKMKEKGIFCYLDDFGTGYSNLERIFGCPFKTVKFDKSVLYTSLNDSAMDEIMVSMIDAFKKKGYNVLVEGVETKEMRDKCIDSGFEYIQGFYYSKPIPIEDLKLFFEKKQ